MKLYRTCAMLFLALLITAADAAAQTRGLSLNDAIAQAIANEPSFRAERALIDVALGEHQQAGLHRNPTASVEWRAEPGGTDNAAMFGVEWPLDLFRRDARIESADREVTVARFAVADRERLLAAEVKAQYGTAVLAMRDVGIVDEIVASVTRQLDLTRARVDEGAAPPLDRDLLEVALGRLRIERLRAASRADVAMIALKRRLGINPEAPLVLQDSIETLLGGVEASATTTPASMESRPDIRESEARVDAATARIGRAESMGRFDVSLLGSYMRMNSGFPQLGFDAAGQLSRVHGEFNYWTLGAMVKLPLFDRNQGAVAVAKADQARAIASRDAITLAARSELATARVMAVRSREALELYAGNIRSLARQNLEVVRQTFDLGRATVFDVLDEQRRYFDFELAYTQALRESWEAQVALTRAIGETK